MFTEKMTRRPAEFAKLTDDEREREREQDAQGRKCESTQLLIHTLSCSFRKNTFIYDNKEIIYFDILEILFAITFSVLLMNKN